jgi:hypothetical protein
MKQFAGAIVGILVCIVGFIWWKFLSYSEDEQPPEQSYEVSEEDRSKPPDFPRPEAFNRPPPLPIAPPAPPDPIDIIPPPPKPPPAAPPKAKKPEEIKPEGKKVTVVPGIVISKARSMEDPALASKLLYESACQIKDSNPVGAMVLCEEVINLLDPGEAYREKAEKLKAQILTNEGG